jgi:hypothetical protein
MSFWHTELRGEAIDTAVHPALRVLLDRWRQAAAADPSGRPPLSAFSPQDMPLFSPHLMLLQAEDDDFRYCHYGSEIHRHTGRNPEGTLLSSIDTPLARFAAQKYCDVLRSASPMYTVHVSQDARSVLTWERLILPLNGPDGSFWILVYGPPARDARAIAGCGAQCDHRRHPGTAAGARADRRAPRLAGRTQQPGAAARLWA